MSALAAARNTNRMGEMIAVAGFYVKTAVKLYNGALVMLDSTGYLVPGAAATGCRAAGRCKTGQEGVVDTTGISSGVVKAEVEVGVFGWDNSGAGADLIGVTEMLKDVYIVDDHTVAKTDGSASRSVAGQVIAIEGSLVYVKTGPVL